jgi:hypothetical protein
MRANLLQADVVNENGIRYSLEALQQIAEHINKQTEERGGVLGADKVDKFFIDDVKGFDLRDARFVAQDARVDNGILSVDVSPIEKHIDEWSKPINTRFRPSLYARLDSDDSTVTRIDGVRSINLIKDDIDANKHVPEITPTKKN